MRIVHVTNDLEVGGVQVYLAQLLPALTARGHQVALVVLTGQGALLADLAAHDIEWRRIEALRRRGRLKWPRLQSIAELRTYFDDTLRPDIVHTHLLIGNTVGRLAALGVRPRPVIIATEHSTYVNKPIWAQSVDRWLGSRSTAIMAVSEAVRQFTLSQEHFAAAKVVTIRLGLVPPNPVPADDSDLYEEMRIRPTIAVVGRLIADKGHELFLDTMAAVFAERPEALALIIGDGPLRRELEHGAHRRWLDRDQVRFLGTRQDIGALAKRIDVFLLPSKREGFGLAPLEAMAGGATVVLSRIPAFEELTDGGRMGTLVDLPPNGSVSDWKHAVLQALATPLDRTEVREYVRTHYGFDRHVDQLVEFYQSTLRAKE